MKRLGIILVLLAALSSGYTQKITFSEYSKKEGRDMYFEILGKFDSTYIIYKNNHQKHFLTKYDQQMRIIENIPLDFVPDRTFNIDFINYRDYFYMIYQYQRNSIVYCKAMKLGLEGKQMSEPVQLDTTRISVLADNKIYSTIYSENKQKILIYKRQLKNDNLSLVTKLYDVNLNLLDSSKRILDFDDRRDVFSDLAVDNNGNFLFAKETQAARRDTNNLVEVILHKPGIDTFRNYKLSLGRKIVEEINIKVDNLNQHYIINAFYYGKRRGNIEGLFTTAIDMNGEEPIRAVFNMFSDSLRYTINSSDKAKFVFDNLVIRNTIFKKSGGFVLSAEDSYSEVLLNNNWNRQYYNSLPYVSSYDYYLSNSYYYGYRPLGSYTRDENKRYYEDDIVMLSLDSALNLEWNNVIHKKQMDIDDDNFLSFSNYNAGGEIHYLYIERDTKKQIINNQSVLPNGEMKRYPTLKSNEVGYGFMPRLAKQVTARQVIIPCVYLGYIAFAKIDF